MMNKKLIYNISRQTGMLMLCCVCLMCMASRCNDEPRDAKLAFFVNGCDEVIYYKISERESPLTPAEILSPGEPPDSLTPWQQVKYVVRNAENPNYKDTKLQILVIRKSTLDKYSRKGVINEGIYDTLIVLNREELKHLDYQVIYSGD